MSDFPPPPPPPSSFPPPSGQPYGHMPEKPKDYLAHSIIATILCCWPLGIVGIIYAAQVNGKYVAGDYDGAVNSSNKAKGWTIASVVIAIPVLLLVVLTGLLGETTTTNY